MRALCPALGHYLVPHGEAVLRHADVVSSHMNLSEDNRAYMNAARLALLKPGAYLINCARGGLVDEGDVAAALQGVSLLATAPMWWSRSPWRRLTPC